MVQIVPSILSADFARLGEEVERVEEGGDTMLKYELMVSCFVPHLKLGSRVLKSRREVTRLPLDVHCMSTDRGRFASIFIEAGEDQVSVHQEVCRHLHRTLAMIR